MRKDKKHELKSKDELKNVSATSKQDVQKAKNKVKNMKDTPAASKELLKVAINESIGPNDNGKSAKKKKKSKKSEMKLKDISEIQSITIVHESDHVKETKELNDKDIAKIEKKKAKKLAQKLKKKQKKSEVKTSDTAEVEVENKNKAPLAKNKQKNVIKENGTSAKETNAKGVKKQQKAEKKKKQKELLKEQHKELKPRDSNLEAATVFVGNLPVNTKRIQLVRLFEDYAPVNALRFRTASGRVMFKHKHRLEAGTLNAYVVLKDAETAERARALNGTNFKGNHLRVTRADKNSHNRTDGGDVDTKRMIFVGNLKYTATEEKLREIFSSCGDIEYVRCLREGEKGCKGVAYVCFKEPDAVGLAMELNETILDERPIHVERYSVKKLGAKQARDEAAATAEKNTKTGAKKRLDDKKQKKGGKKVESEGNDKKKKSEYRGVKVDAIKKKQKKKKASSQMQKLAKKIAPKTK